MAKKHSYQVTAAHFAAANAPHRVELIDVPSFDGTERLMRLFTELCDSLQNRPADGVGFFRRGFTIRPDSWVCDATPLAAWFYTCLEACVENRPETVFGEHSEHVASTRNFSRR